MQLGAKLGAVPGAVIWLAAEDAIQLRRPDELPAYDLPDPVPQVRDAFGFLKPLPLDAALLLCLAPRRDVGQHGERPAEGAARVQQRGGARREPQLAAVPPPHVEIALVADAEAAAHELLARTSLGFFVHEG